MRTLRIAYGTKSEYRTFRRCRLIRPVFLEDSEDDVAHLPCNSADGSQVMLSPGFEGLAVLGEYEVTKGALEAASQMALRR